MPVLLAVAALEALAGLVLLGARGAGEVPAFLLVTAAATAAVAVLLLSARPPADGAVRHDPLPPPPEDPWPGLREAWDADRSGV